MRCWPAQNTECWNVVFMNRKKYKKIISYALCSMLAWTSIVPVHAASTQVARNIVEADILARYPQAKILHVEPADYPQLTQQLRKLGYATTTAAPAKSASG
jgi:hypothetical protein